MEVTVYFILNGSEDLIVSECFKDSRQLRKRKLSEGCMCQSVRLKRLVGEEGWGGGGGGGHKYRPFLERSAFLCCQSL